MYDIMIIGAGIVGTMLARDLSEYNLKIALLDKENDIADGTTMANSAIIHTGYDPEDGTLKAQLNVKGAEVYEELCQKLHCRYKKIGAFIAACGEEEEKHLDVLMDRADRRNIPYHVYTGDEARGLEKNLSDHVTKVVDFYTTAVVYPWEIALASAQVAKMNGTDVMLGCEVLSIEKNDYFTVHTSKGDFETKWVLNASGIHTEQIYRMVCDNPEFHIHPKKGEYYVLDQGTNFVNRIVFPVPGKKGKGVLAVPTVFENVLLGPNAEYVDDELCTTSRSGLQYVRDNIEKTMKNVPYNKIIRTFAGLRPSSDSDDFLIYESPAVENFVNIASIESPGLASAPAISRYVIDDILSKKMNLVKKENYVQERKRPVVMQELSKEEKEKRIAQNPSYAKIICRCETISEGEIVDCIHEVLGAGSVKGVKKRVRPGMGRCQGGFCEPRVVAILARELHVPMTDIVLDGEGSTILEKENR